MSTSRRSTLYRYCSYAGFFVPKGGDGSAVTHTLFDGGRIAVPPKSMPTFLDAYAESLQHGDRLYVVERRTPLFRMLADFDFFCTGKTLSLDDILDTLRVTQQLLGEMFPTESRRLVVCTAPSKLVTKEGKQWVKTGFHAVWPDLWVSEPTANLVRDALLERLESVLGEIEGPGGWGEVLDRSVYTGNGLRMIGSRKGHYVDKKFVDEGRVYTVVRVFDNNCQPHQESAWITDYLRVVQETSLRSDGLLKPPMASKLANPLPQWILAIQKTTKQTTEKSKNKRGAHSILVTNDDKTKALNALLGIAFPNGNHQVRQINANKGGSSYIVKSTSKHCMNKGGEHNGCDVYFVVDKNHIYQRCYCRCGSVRRYGKCADYTSPRYKITRAAQTALFESECKKRKSSHISFAG